MIIKFKDGTSIIDDCAESHDNDEDSYSIADVMNQILRYVEWDIQEGDRQVVYDEYGDIDLVNTVGLEHVGWERSYYSGAPHNEGVDEFISEFHHYDHDVSATFTRGCCYWFAYILHARFPGSRIMLATEYLPRHSGALHFVTEIDGRLYDITGDVTEEYKVIPWDEVKPGPYRDGIIRDCVDMRW